MKTTNGNALGRRSRKRLATREAISNVATTLFMERGFDAVTIDEVAEAADVGRITVFNHFPRKEDLFFDRDDEGRELLRQTVRQHDLAPIEAYRLLAHRLVAEGSPFVDFSARSQRFMATIDGSETLKARARAIRDDLTQVVAEALSEHAGRVVADLDSRLAASLLLATWSVAFIEAHRTFGKSQNVKQANAVLLAVIDQGTIGVRAAMKGTPYA